MGFNPLPSCRLFSCSRQCRLCIESDPHIPTLLYRASELNFIHFLPPTFFFFLKIASCHPFCTQFVFRRWEHSRPAILQKGSPLEFNCPPGGAGTFTRWTFVEVENLVFLFPFSVFFLSIETVPKKGNLSGHVYSRNLLSPKFDLIPSFTLYSSLSHIFKWSLT